jgi:lycopene cyclase domain-containing protein
MILKLGYVGMLGFTVIGSFWLEALLKVNVLKRSKRWALSILPIAIPFIGWDAYAISRQQWSFDPAQILEIYGPFDIPIEEYLFFLIVPIAAIMTIEAVRKVNKHWLVGDEE